MLGKFFAAVIIFFQTLTGFIFNNHSPNNQLIEAKNLQANINQDALFVKEQLNPLFPLRDWRVEDIDIKAVSVLAFDVNSQKILYQKNINQPLPIASLTKLLTASIVLEQMNLNDTVVISKKAVETFGEMGRLTVGEKISVRNLLYLLLMASSNDAAEALAEYLQETKNLSLPYLMNQKIKEWGLTNSRFSDASGLAPDDYSSAWDLAQIVQKTLDQSMLWKILKTESFDLQSSDGLFNHHLENSNKLLNKIEGVLGGKTGYTEEAGECLILVIKTSKNTPLILIILNADDRFKKMQDLVDWVRRAYIW